MPTIRDISGPYRFFFYSFDCNEPMHVHAQWSWRLSNATPDQRQRFEIIGSGQGIHWPEIDEDISPRGMLHGMPARPPKQTA
jgi:hypothetical protein